MDDAHCGAGVIVKDAVWHVYCCCGDNVRTIGSQSALTAGYQNQRQTPSARRSDTCVVMSRARVCASATAENTPKRIKR